MDGELSKKEFEVLAAWMRKTEPARTAAFMVLVKGKAVHEAVTATSMSQPAVSQAVRRYREKHATILTGYARRK